ncbi:MAG: argininosuccinate lyase [Candidatus Porifericomitaceae bacterium WSBS_2022_MAG_OTU9]
MSSNPVQSGGKPWGGRFSIPTSNLVESFGASVEVDKCLYPYDITASIAHVRMLAATNILELPVCERIVAGLEQVLAEIEQGDFVWRQELEDVHMNIEARLVELIGDDGKKLHTARSRNDQVATDMRLYLRDAVGRIRTSLERLMLSLTDLAEKEADTIMPGMTHLQPAQPVSFGHHMLAWFEMLLRDHARLADAKRRINVSPLGAAALAGTGFPIDPTHSAASLGFDEVAANSLDAVSDRDFCIEFVSTCATLMMHLSRFSEELVLWMNPEFGFIELPDSHCTGSSIMPQKKNPDLAELVRGKSASVFGSLMSLLVLMKAQPLAYNRDNQEDKKPVFDTVGTTLSCLAVYEDIVSVLKVKRERMRQAAECGFPTATELADYLVAKEISFRDAHAIAGRAVALAEQENCQLQDLPLKKLKHLSKFIEQDVYARLQLDEALSRRDHICGSAPRQVRLAAAKARQRLMKQREGVN